MNGPLRLTDMTPQRFLVTGCSGFIGFHLAGSLASEGRQVFGTYHRKPFSIEGVKPLVCDLTDRRAVGKIVDESRPDIIFHLGGQTNIPLSWKDFEGTFQANVFGTYYLLEALREKEWKGRIVIAGSSSEYGPTQNRGALLDENAPFRPTNPYALSKVTVDLLSRVYFNALGLCILRVIPFYVIGPRKAPDAPSDFAKAIQRHREGTLTCLAVGNLKAVRDVVDVRDAIRALQLIREKGEVGTSYNLCTGKETSLEEILNRMLKLSKSNLPVAVDPAKLRIADETRVVGDPRRLEQLGWKPRYSLDETLKSIVDYWANPVEVS